MESNQLLEIDHLAATPFIEYPTTPSWYPALIGGYWTAMTGAILAGRHGHPVWTVVIALAALVVLMGYLRSYRARWGTWPLMSNAPAEIRRAYMTNLRGLILCVALTAVAFALAPWFVTLAVGFVSFTTLYWLYERRIYPGAVARVKARLK